jgi:hypothetical protein
MQAPNEDHRAFVHHQPETIVTYPDSMVRVTPLELLDVPDMVKRRSVFRLFYGFSKAFF